MKRVACSVCNMRGRVFGNDLCTNCAGTGFVNVYSGGGGGGGGGRGPVPIGASFQKLIILGGSGFAAWRVWQTNPGDDALPMTAFAFGTAFVVLTLIVGFLTRPRYALIVAVLLVGLDVLVLDGVMRQVAATMVPTIIAALGGA